MEQEGSRNIKLGVFVTAGVLLLIVALYLMGSQRELFTSTFKVSANFRNVSGLMVGNNVRFAGIDVGTVTKVRITNDSSVLVEMVIEQKIKSFIKKSAIASIGTDGLMGNKIVNINYGTDGSKSVEEGDVLNTLRPIEMETVFRTLNSTNDNLADITTDLKSITQKINTSKVLSKLLSDTSFNKNINETILNIKRISDKSIDFVTDLNKITGQFKNKNSVYGNLISDTIMGLKVKSIISNLDSTGKKLGEFSTDLNKIVNAASSGQGSVNKLLTDTALAGQLNRSMQNIEQGSANFSQDMEALKSNFLLRGYFKKLEKEKKKGKK